MLAIKKGEMINTDMVEAICMYNSEPLLKLARKARETGNIRELRGRYGYKSLIIMDDGYLFLCPNNPTVYFPKLDEKEYFFFDPKRYAIKKSLVRELSAKPNKGQREDIMKAKQEGRYINLARNKKVRSYVFTTGGRIYGLASGKGSVINDNSPK